LEAESTKSVVELGDFSLNDQSVKELIPTVDYTCLIEELPLLLAQVTKIHGEESTTLKSKRIKRLLHS
ncbi:hypothetical protein HN51_015857, partial [Arachis hypogaea]